MVEVILVRSVQLVVSKRFDVENGKRYPMKTPGLGIKGMNESWASVIRVSCDAFVSQ